MCAERRMPDCFCEETVTGQRSNQRNYVPNLFSYFIGNPRVQSLSSGSIDSPVSPVSTTGYHTVDSGTARIAVCMRESACFQWRLDRIGVEDFGTVTLVSKVYRGFPFTASERFYCL